MTAAKRKLLVALVEASRTEIALKPHRPEADVQAEYVALAPTANERERKRLREMYEEDRKARPARLKRIRDFQQAGKLPAGWLKAAEPVKFGGAGLSDHEAARVVLPTGLLYGSGESHGTGPTFKATGADLWTHDVANRYLVALGVPYVPQEAAYKCGCKVHGDGSYKTGRAQRVEACERHERAFYGRDED